MDAMEWHAMLNLACWLHDDMSPPRCLHDTREHDRFRVDGGIVTTGGTAHLSVHVDASWIHKPPSVICHEPWLRHGAEWHADGYDNSLCYVFEREWKDKIEGLVASRGTIVAARVARFWIPRNVSWLLGKHLLADHLGLPAWKKAWGFYAHGYKEALREYASHQRTAAGGKPSDRHLRGRR